MKHKIRIIVVLLAVGTLLFTTSCYLLGPKKSADNYVVLTTDDWTFTEYIFSDSQQLDVFVSQVKEFYDEKKDADFLGAFREYLSIKRLARYSEAIKQVRLKEVPAMFSMPLGALLTFVRNGEVEYGRMTYDGIMGEFEKKKMQQTW